jgi:predicted dehydrogenase
MNTNGHESIHIKNQKSRTHSLGLIGLGDIVHKHVATVNELEEFEITALCDMNRERLDQWQGRIGGHAFTDCSKLLAATPDVVVVSLPHALHAPVTIEALEAGCHVIVEKPMAVTVHDCRRMLETARRCGRSLIVAEGGCFEPGVVETGRRFSRGELGRFLTGSIVNARHYFHEGRPQWFLDAQASGGGMFCNVGVHRLANARGCLPGQHPVSVTATSAHVPEHPVEACTSALVRYRGGGSMLYEEVGYFKKPPWQNTGSHFVFEEGIVGWDETSWRMMSRRGEEVSHPLPPADATYAPVYRNLLLAMEGKPHAPKTWEFAVDATIAQAAYESARTGGTVDLMDEAWRIDERRTEDDQ